MGKEWATCEVVHQLAFISREVRGWAGVKNGGGARVVVVKTIIIRIRLSVWAQEHQCQATAGVTSSGAQIVVFFSGDWVG